MTVKSRVLKYFFVFLGSQVLFCGLSNPESLYSEEVNGVKSTQTATDNTTLESIDKSIEELEKKLEVARRNSFNEEMQAQPHLFDDWQEYAKDIDQTEGYEKQVIALKKQIEVLKNKRELLLKSKDAK